MMLLSCQSNHRVVHHLIVCLLHCEIWSDPILLLVLVHVLFL